MPYWCWISTTNSQCFSQDEVTSESVEEVLLGLSSQLGEREDSVLCSDVRNNLFGPMEFSRRDLAALNIMRGRDNGLPDYNTVRKCHNLEMVNDWGEWSGFLIFCSYTERMQRTTKYLSG